MEVMALVGYTVFVLHQYAKFNVCRPSGLIISRPGDLDLLTLTLKLVRITARGVDNRPTNFGVSRSFRSRLIDQHLSDASRDFATLTIAIIIYLLISSWTKTKGYIFYNG